MTKTEVKKMLYKEKPTAVLSYIRKGVAYYLTIDVQETVRFEVPVDDMGDADFLPQMPAQQLNRWIVSHND